MKRIFIAFLSMLLCIITAVSSFVIPSSRGDYYNEGVEAYLDTIFGILEREGVVSYAEASSIDEAHPPRVVDDAELLTEDEKAELANKLDDISSRQECDVVIVTVAGLEGKTAQEYADDYYDYNKYGMGDGADGILLLISMEDRDWALTTYGFGITAFTDAGQEYIMELTSGYLGEGQYADAFAQFSDLCDDFLMQAHTAEPYDVGNMPDDISALGRIMWIIPSVIIGAVISLVLKKKKRKALKNVRRKSDAADYVAGMELTGQYDRFLYSDVQRVKIRDDKDDGYDGSNFHISSSGRGHGGSSGKF